MPRTDYDRVAAENEDLRKRVATQEVQPPSAMASVSFVIVALFVAWAAYHAFVRGKTYSPRTERQYATQAAREFAEHTYNRADVRDVYCGGESNGGDMNCTVVLANGAVPLWCDDDAPFANDGCRRRTDQ